MYFLAFSHMFKHTWVGSHEFLLIESIAKLLSGLFNLLIYLFIVLSHQFLDKNVGTITLLRIAVINKRIIKRIYVSRSLPSGWMHENSGIDTHNISMQQTHEVPPVPFNIVFQFNAILTVIVNSAKAIVDFA